jgi:hypothetical protein
MLYCTKQGDGHRGYVSTMLAVEYDGELDTNLRANLHHVPLPPLPFTHYREEGASVGGQGDAILSCSPPGERC